MIVKQGRTEERRNETCREGDSGFEDNIVVKRIGEAEEDFLLCGNKNFFNIN